MPPTSNAGDAPSPPPEGVAIEAARERAVPAMSMRRAAKLAGMSVTRWRQIVLGQQWAGSGHAVPVVGPADTIARMAEVVGLTGDELAAAGRPDAAERLALRDAASAAQTTELSLDAQRRRIQASNRLSKQDKQRLLLRLDHVEATFALAQEALDAVERELEGSG